MSYAILRTEKIKSLASMRLSEQHNTRERRPPNADPERAHLNQIIIGSPNDQTIIDQFKELTTGMKVRSNAVLAVEVLMCFSPEATETIQLDDWIKENRTWLENTFGKENLVGLQLHMDETTPHLHAHVIPISQGRLCAKDYLGGKAKLQALQTNYAETMKQFGLERAIEHSTAKHEKLKDYYSNIQRLQEPLPQAGMLERGSTYQKRTEDQWVAMQSKLKYVEKENKALKESHKTKDSKINQLLHETSRLRDEIVRFKRKFQQMYLQPEYGHAEIDRLYKESASQVNDGTRDNEKM